MRLGAGGTSVLAFEKDMVLKVISEARLREVRDTVTGAPSGGGLKVRLRI